MSAIQLQRRVAGAALAALAAGGAFAASLPPCGACAHITENEYPHLEETCEWFRMGGLQVVRADIEWNRMQRKPDAPIVFDSIDQDYTSLDLVLTTCERYGIQLLPVFNRIPDWAKPIDEHLDALAAFVRAFVERYGRRCPTVEFLNEVNLSKEYTGTNLVRYVRALRTVYETVKSVDPNIRVSFSGLAGEGADYLKEAYAAGAGRWFDVYSCHPYSNPLPPDTATHVRLDERLERLRAVMAANGDAKKPILVTELGWSTQSEGIGPAETAVLETGLKIARPGRKTWRAAYIEPRKDGRAAPPDVARAIQNILPPGSQVATCTSARLKEMLARGTLDLVVYTIRNERYPADVQDAVADFVRKGGVLAEMGGMPLFIPDDPSRDAAADRRALRIDAFDPWSASKPPARLRAFATETAVKAGFRRDMSGYIATRYISGRFLAQGDEFVPLVAGTAPDGRELAAAAVYRFNSDMKGAVIVSALMTLNPAQAIGTTTEEDQANFLARGLGICFAEGVESVLAYEFRSPEGDPYYSECHYGLVHDNFAPKPAFSAYRTFSRLRPPGSVQLPGDWRDAGRIDYFPRWTRPDGREAGMFWTTGTGREKTVSFGGRRMRFYNTTGRIVKMPSPDGKSFVIPLSGEPVYYLCTDGVPPTETRPKEPSAIIRLPDAVHARATRRMLCAPSLAASRSGRRLWASWFAGVTDFEDSNNYVVLATSVDGGVTWREVLAVDPDSEGPRRCFDPQLWTTPDGQLHWTWIDRRAVLRDGMDMRRGGDRWGMSGGAHPYGDQTWMLSFDAEREPPADLPAPIYVGLGLEACKPAALSTGEWLLPLYVNHGRPPSANFYATRDHRTFAFLPGISIPKEKQGFEEHTLVERRNGDLWCLLRADGGLQEAISRDKGRTWSEARPPAGLKHTSSRLFLRRLASGNLLLVKHGKPNEDAGRTNLSAFISEDDGVTWKGGLLLDERLHASYPDGDQLPDGTILVVYDHDRSRHGTVHLAQFTEADVLAGRDVSGKLRRRGLITQNPSWREP